MQVRYKNKTEPQFFPKQQSEINSIQGNSAVDKLVEDILHYEDKINNISQNINLKNKNNQEMIDNITRDVEKNNSRINLLEKFIEAEEEELGNFIQKKEEEKENINKLIGDLEQEMLNLKKLNENENIISELIKSVNEEMKVYEKDLERLGDKKKKIEKELNEFSIKKEALIDTISMLREEKENTQGDLVNLISKKESLEEIINVNNFSFFKGTNYSQEFTSSVNSLKSIELYNNEINLLDRNKLAQALYECLTEMFTFEISNRCLINSISTSKFLFKIDKLGFESLVKRSMDNYKEGKGLFNVDDFFFLITKKIYDLIYSTGAENRSFLKELNVEKLRIFLKHFFKVQYYEHIISYKINFLNKEYKLIKKDKQLTISDINNKTNQNLKKLDEIENKENELKNKVDCLLERTDDNGFKLSAIKECDRKLKLLIDNKTNLNVEIYSTKSKTKKRKETYYTQSLQISKINEELKWRKLEVENKLEKIISHNKEQIIIYRNKIAEKFQDIKSIIRARKDCYIDFSKTSNTVTKYIDKINHTFKDNQVEGNISPLKITSVKRLFSPERNKPIFEASRNLNEKIEKNNSEDNITDSGGNRSGSKNFRHLRSISQNEILLTPYMQTDIEKNKTHSRNSSMSKNSLFKDKNLNENLEKQKMKECVNKIKNQIEEVNHYKENDCKILEKVKFLFFNFKKFRFNLYLKAPSAIKEW
jgi:hypothetical protein